MLRECNPREVVVVKKVRKPVSYAERTVHEFVESGMRCAEVLDFDQGKILAVYQAMRNAAIKSRRCECKKRGGRLYLLRKEY